MTDRNGQQIAIGDRVALMTIETTARRLVLCPRWKWQFGAVGRLGRSVFRVTENTVDASNMTASGWIPDLNDPATIGTIEAQVRALRPDFFLSVHQEADGFFLRWEHKTDWTQNDASPTAPSIGEVWALAFLEVASANS